MNTHFPEIPEIALASFDDDPRRRALQLAAKRHAEEVLSILGGDFELLRDFYCEVASEIDNPSPDLAFDGEQEAGDFEQNLANVTRDLQTIYAAQQKEKDEAFAREKADHDRQRNRWRVTQDYFRDTPTGRHFGAILEKVDPIRTPKDPQAHIIKMLKAYASFLEKVEPDFRAYAALSGHEIAFSREDWIRDTPAEEMSQKHDQVIFLDDQVLHTDAFRGHVLQALTQAILQNRPDKVLELAQYRSQVPQVYASIFPSDFDLWPERIRGLHDELADRLRRGLQIKEARQLGEKYHIDDRHVVMKTWLDRRSEAGELVKGKRDGKVAYFLAGHQPGNP